MPLLHADKSISWCKSSSLQKESFMFVKVIKVGDKEIKLVHNPLTYILYKNYTGRDLLDDTMKLGINMKNKEIEPIAKKAQNGIETLTEEELVKITDAILCSNSTEYMLYLTAALIATAQHPKKVVFDDIIADLPDDILYDAEFLKVLTDFITINIDRVKKKVMAAAPNIKTLPTA